MMRNVPRRNAVITAATSVLVLGGVAIAVPAIAAAAQKPQSTSIASAPAKTKKNNHSGKPALAPATSPSPSSTAPAPGPGKPDFDGDGPGGRGGEMLATAVQSVLSDLVSKGTLTQAQADAVLAGLTAKRDAMQKAHDSFRSQADAIIAKVLGVTVEQLNTARQNGTPPTMSDVQRAEIKKQLDALRTSLGLPTPPAGMGDGKGPRMMGDGFGRGHHMGHHMGGFMGGFGDRDRDGDAGSAPGTDG